MKKLTPTERKFLKENLMTLQSAGINIKKLRDANLDEGILGAIASMAVGGPAGLAAYGIYSMLSGDFEEEVENVVDYLEDFGDAAADLLSGMEDVYGEVEDEGLRAAMESAGEAAVMTIKEATDAAFATVTETITAAAAGKEEAEEVDEGPQSIAQIVMASALAKVVAEFASD